MCLKWLRTADAKELVQKFHMRSVAVVKDMQERASNYLDLGFAEALKQAQRDERKAFHKDRNVPPPGSEKLKNYFWNVWRPYVEPKCQPMMP